VTGVGVFGFSGSNVPQETTPQGTGVFGIGLGRGLAPAFEHVGEVRLRRGRATVKLPRQFDGLVPGKRYQVFLTEYGNLGGLYVSSRGERQFKVRSRRRRANGRIGYRVVAVRSDLRS
jgi:hypothetical protein